MFEQTFIPSPTTHKPWTVPIAFLGELVLLGIAILIPMMLVRALPTEHLVSELVAPAPPPPAPPPAPAQQAVKTEREVLPHRLFAPTTIPKTIVIPKTQEELAPPPVSGVVAGVPGGVPGGRVGGVIGGIIGSVGRAVPPPPVAKPSMRPPAVPQRIRVGGNVQQALLINNVLPVYPAVAKSARIQGVVRLDAVIAKNGRIESLKVVSGEPLLLTAAVQAVKQWVYKPTLLNGVPVEVATEIDVRFTLG